MFLNKNFVAMQGGILLQPYSALPSYLCALSALPSYILHTTNHPPSHSVLTSLPPGYYASLKSCMAGLVLVCDMNVSAFLAGGPLINVMMRVGEFRNLDDMLQQR